MYMHKKVLWFVFNKKRRCVDMEKSYSFRSIIVPANHDVTVKCFVNKGCTTRKPVILLCVVYT